MSTSPLPPSAWHTRVDEYLDNAMSPSDRQGFEAAMAKDQALREMIELQSKIDQSLGRLFDEAAAAGPQASQAAPALKISGVDAPRPALPAWRRWAWLGAAAAVVLAVVGVWLSMPMRPAPPPPPTLKFVSAQQAYDAVAARGFKPQWVCESDQQFAAIVEEKLGRAMVVPQATPGVEVRGWGYGNDRDGYTLSKDTMILMTRVDGDDVLVFMDRADRDKGLTVDEPGRLKIFRRELDGIVLYEVTPRDKPAVLDAAVLK